MAWLAISTSSDRSSVALFDGETLLRCDASPAGRGHAERLLPMIAALLDGLPPPGAVRVDAGPGSFTGVRIGVAAARALGLAWGVPVRGVSSLALIAAARGEGRCRAAVPDGRGGTWTQWFDGGLAEGHIETGPPSDVIDLPDAAAMGKVPEAAWLPPVPLYLRAADALTIAERAARQA